MDNSVNRSTLNEQVRNVVVLVVEDGDVADSGDLLIEELNASSQAGRSISYELNDTVGCRGNSGGVGACGSEACKLNRSGLVVELELSVATTTDCNGVHCTESGISSAVLEADALVGVTTCSSGVQVSAYTTDNRGTSCIAIPLAALRSTVVATAEDNLAAESRRQEVNRGTAPP